MTIEEENVLIDKAIKNDQEAFERLFLENENYILNFAVGRCKDSNLAKEIFQVAMIKAWKNLSKFKKTSSFKTWVCRIAANHFYDLKRQGLRMREIPIDGEDDEKTWLPINLSSRVERSFSHSYFSASTQTALFFLERGEEEDSQKDLANKLLDSLPEINRQIFKAVIMEKESYKSVARRFKLPIGTIMSKIFYIKQKLRKEAKSAIKKAKK